MEADKSSVLKPILSRKKVAGKKRLSGYFEKHNVSESVSKDDSLDNDFPNDFDNGDDTHKRRIRQIAVEDNVSASEEDQYADSLKQKVNDTIKEEKQHTKEFCKLETKRDVDLERAVLQYGEQANVDKIADAYDAKAEKLEPHADSLSERISVGIDNQLQKQSKTGTQKVILKNDRVMTVDADVAAVLEHTMHPKKKNPEFEEIQKKAVASDSWMEVDDAFAKLQKTINDAQQQKQMFVAMKRNRLQNEFIGYEHPYMQRVLAYDRSVQKPLSGTMESFVPSEDTCSLV